MTPTSCRECGVALRFGMLALLLAACGEPGPSTPDYTAYRRLMTAREVEVEVPDQPDLLEPVNRAIELESRALGRPVRRVAPGAAAPGSVRMIVGLPDTLGVPELLERLGVTVEPRGFQLTEVAPELLVDAIVATVGDPARPGSAVTLVCALDAAGLAPFLRSVRPTWRAGLRAYWRGDLLLEARLSQAGEVREVERLDGLRAVLASGASIEDDGLVIHVAPGTPERELLSWRRANVAARRAVGTLLGGSGASPRLQAQTYAHAEDLCRLTRDSRLSRLNPVTGAVHALVAAGQPHDGGFGVARAAALIRVGRPAHDWMLDGVAAASVKSWWGRPLGSWVAFLIEGGGLPGPQTLVDPLASGSPHMLVPLRGVLFGFLVKRLGAEEVQRIWRGERELELDAELVADFSAALELRRERRQAGLRDTRALRLAASLQRSDRRKGVNLLEPADPGYLRGFGTRACERSLEDLAATGANSVALVFRGAITAGPERFALGHRSGELEFLVSDLELITTARAARARGLSTMFKPELLARASGIRIGDKAAESSAEASRFFYDSRRFLVHAALVAELCEADVLCFGTQLRHVAGTLNPNLPEFMQENQAAWTELIAALRGAFRGALTYAADWRGEVGDVEFWSQLDYVGVSLYPALGVGLQRDRPDDAWAERNLLHALRNLIGDADERFRPALICEVGFASTSRAWDQPEAAHGTPDLAEQARMYGVLERVLGDHYMTREMFEGLYLWSWSTDPDAGRALDRSFTPQNRPAREVAARLFESL